MINLTTEVVNTEVLFLKDLIQTYNKLCQFKLNTVTKQTLHV